MSDFLDFCFTVSLRCPTHRREDASPRKMSGDFVPPKRTGFIKLFFVLARRGLSDDAGDKMGHYLRRLVLFQEALIEAHAGDFHEARNVNHHGKLKEISHGCTGIASI